MTPLTTKAAEIGAGLVAELRAACVGHPNASIAWPHRVLHQAADLIEQQAAELAEARERGDRYQHIADEHRSFIGELKPRLASAESERDSWRRVCERLETEKQAALAERDELLREKERLEAALRKKDEALKPFAVAFDNAVISGRPPFEFVGANDFEDARAALAPLGEG